MPRVRQPSLPDRPLEIGYVRAEVGFDALDLRAAAAAEVSGEDPGLQVLAAILARASAAGSAWRCARRTGSPTGQRGGRAPRQASALIACSRLHGERGGKGWSCSAGCSTSCATTRPRRTKCGARKRCGWRSSSRRTTTCQLDADLAEGDHARNGRRGSSRTGGARAGDGEGRAPHRAGDLQAEDDQVGSNRAIERFATQPSNPAARQLKPFIPAVIWGHLDGTP